LDVQQGASKAAAKHTRLFNFLGQCICWHSAKGATQWSIFRIMAQEPKEKEEIILLLLKK
jgi:hypothetical protein